MLTSSALVREWYTLLLPVIGLFIWLLRVRHQIFGFNPCRAPSEPQPLLEVDLLLWFLAHEQEDCDDALEFGQLLLGEILGGCDWILVLTRFLRGTSATAWTWIAIWAWWPRWGALRTWRAWATWWWATALRCRVIIRWLRHWSLLTTIFTTVTVSLIILEPLFLNLISSLSVAELVFDNIGWLCLRLLIH